MSQEQHTWDVKNMPSMHKVKTGPDCTARGVGACLNRHNSGRSRVTGYLFKSSCNYRYQAFRRALGEDSGKYNWPAYESIHERVQTTKRGKPRKTITLVSRTRGGQKRHPLPTEQDKAWDISADRKNFQTRCNVPYWHEAHHIIPNAELQQAIAKAGAGGERAEVYNFLIRFWLLRERYNLNHMTNMILLPMAREVAYALGLPRHRVSAKARSHGAYSTNVRLELDKIMGLIQEELQKHITLPGYDICKEQLESLSERLRKGIEEAGASMKKTEEWKNNSLDDMKEKDFKPKKQISSAGSLSLEA